MALKPEFVPSTVVTRTYLFLDDVVDQDNTPPSGYPATWGGTAADYGMSQNADDLPLIAGDLEEWNELRALAAIGLADNASCQRIQGNNPDGTRNPDYDVLIDIDNFIDFVIHGQFTGSTDWPGNYYAVRDSGPDSQGFQFFTWDNDLAFPANDKVTPNPSSGWWTESPGELDIALRQNAEYRIRFADRVQPAVRQSF